MSNDEVWVVLITEVKDLTQSKNEYGKNPVERLVVFKHKDDAKEYIIHYVNTTFKQDFDNEGDAEVYVLNKTNYLINRFCRGVVDKYLKGSWMQNVN